jgi:hypothetical protein
MTIESLLRQLPRPPRETELFRIYHGSYSTDGERRTGYRGSRCSSLVDAYDEALHRAFAVLRKKVFLKTEPPIPVEVAVFHLPDVTFGLRNLPTTVRGRPASRILLSNRSHETSVQARLDRAATEAAHEVCHVFQQACEVSQRDLRWQDWAWLNEAAAVFCEHYVYPDGNESLFYCQDWLYFPELSLDRQTYASGMFVRWFADCFGVSSVGRIWEEAGVFDGPIERIEVIAGKPMEDLFTEYVLDGYFLGDPECHFNLSRVEKSWGTRETYGPIELPAESGKSFDGRIDHLAALYFEIHCASGAVYCEIEQSEAAVPLRAQIAEVMINAETGGLRRGTCVELKCNSLGVLTAQTSSSVGSARYVLVISNGTLDRNNASFKLTVTNPQ